MRRVVRGLFRDGVITQGRAGIIAMCTDVDATGLARSPARYFYSRDNCLDVFEDLSCPNDKRSCIDCYGEGH